MPLQEKNVHKKKPLGRPPGQRFTGVIPVRLSPQIGSDVAAWAIKNEISRSEAIRRLIERGLKK